MRSEPRGPAAGEAAVTRERTVGREVASRCELLELTLVEEPRGWLGAAEAFSQVPFEIKRVYWLSGIPPGGERAHHAHREQKELLVAARGAFTVHCDDGRVRSVYRLDSPACGLLLPEMVWHHLEGFSEGALCLVLASGPYDYDEYVHDHGEFREITASW
jgi:dTDP-4-dehydrorhamnose 3,5-epimerase-like enzyme